MEYTKFLPLLFFLFLSGCTDTLVRDPVTTVDIVLDDEFNLAKGESAVFPPKFLTIRFVRLESDSRCALGVACVWAGNGRVIMEINGNKTELNTILDPTLYETRGLTVRLTSLTPFPVAGFNFDESDHVAGITVSEN